MFTASKRLAASLMFFLAAAVHLSLAAEPGGDLVRGFVEPPASARPGVWWLWMNGNITKEGLTRDIEEMARQGIGKVLIYDVGFGVGPKGPADFLGPQWREMFKHAVAEADRLGIEVSVDYCSGWNCGGPWIKAPNASQKLIWSEKPVEGPAKFAEVLPMPAPVVDKHYKDIAVVAFRTPAAGRSAGQATATQSSTGYGGAAERAIDGDTNGLWANESVSHTAPGDTHPWWQLDLGKEAAIDALEIWRRTDPGEGSVQLNHADVLVLDAQKKVRWKSNLGVLQKPSIRLNVGIPAGRYIRIEKQGQNLSIAEVLVFSGGKNIANLGRIPDWGAKAVRVWSGLPVQWKSGQAPEAMGVPDVQPGSLVDLSAKMDAAGRLAWEVPAGHWLILRFGHTALGARTKGSTRAGAGYEVDPFSSEAMDLHFAALARKLIEDAGPQAGKVVRYFFIDSWESGPPNWTPRFRQEFQRRRGYDLVPYLPVLTGRIVQNVEVSERFLWDYRRTIGDLFAENFYGHAAELLRARGLGLQAEAYGGYFDTLQNLGRTDIPCGEFWTPPKPPPKTLLAHPGRNIDASCRAAASAGHIYGRRVINACSFINYEKWQSYPFFLKPYGDRAFCEGINLMFSPACIHQPKLDEKPGLCPPWGCITDRNITWWPQSHAWHKYLARCSFLLQQGQYVADLCCFRGEGVPYSLSLNPALIPAGYGYDECNAEVLLTRMSVKDGRIMLPDGMSYRLLVLPDSQGMTPRVLGKIAELVAAGASVVGPKPRQSPSLTDYPACDERVKQLAEKVWGPCDGKAVKQHAFGKGKVYWGKPLAEILAELKLEPDFEFASGQENPVVRWIHRHCEGAEIYFVANLRDRYEELQCTFRTSGKAPELWMPDTGRICRQAVYDEWEGRTRMPLRLDPLGSVFVVFRGRAERDRIVSLAKDGQAIFPGPPAAVSQTPVVEIMRGGDAGAELKIWQPGKYELRTAAGKQFWVEVTAIPGPLEIAGPWELCFPAGWGAPASVVFDRLTSWTKHPDPGVKYFSGTATYRRQIGIPATLVSKDKILYLDLGEVKYLAEVRFNGTELGVLWKPPFRVGLSGVAKPGKNLLEVKVTNLWPNRLIGDQFLPESKRVTRTNDKSYTKESPLLESGLLGPVTIGVVESRQLETK